MRTLYTFLAFFICTSVFAQSGFKTQVENIFVNIPIDSTFEILSAYASENGFTYIDDKSMDSSGITYVADLKQKRLYNIPLVSSYMHINYSDSLFAGDSLYKNSYSISYSIELRDYKSLKKVYNKLLLQFSKVCSSSRPFKRSKSWSGAFYGMRFYIDSFTYPTLFVAYSLTNFGDKVTVTYLKQKETIK